MRVYEGRAARAWVERAASRTATRDATVERTAAKIVNDVRKGGEKALLRYARKFDGVDARQSLRVSRQEMERALTLVSREFVRALRSASANIRRFASWQKPKSWTRTMQPGVRVGQKIAPLSSVGCYVPGGRYPLPSSLLMTVIPAQVARVKRIVVASPNPAPETLAAAALLGVDEFYRIGGAQAIAALAYGTESIGRVDKIVGPGNAYVTAAKKLVSFDCAIDMLAGPTEMLYISDDGDPHFIASDMVAQAEHDPDAVAVFMTTKRDLAARVIQAVSDMSHENPIAKKSLSANGAVLVAGSADEAFEWANRIAPEHISVAPRHVDRIANAGSAFLGDYSAQALGDYASGPNHVLPTGGAARFRGGLSVLDFVKIITVQEVSRIGLRGVGPVAETLANAEGLKAHAASVRMRLGDRARAAGGRYA